MKIIRVINNNVISSIDEKGKEVVIMGKGIGFQKKAGEAVDESAIEKIFHLPANNMSQFESLLEDMPYEHIRIAKDIIVYARQKLNRHLNKNIYITLTDHLSYAIERHRQNIHFQNALLWEIKKYYQEEFQMGLQALEMVKEELGIELPEDEAGFIALHFVNAEMDGDMHQSIGMPVMIKDVMSIIKYHFGIEIKEDTLAYERFITHLKFFIQRAVSGQCYEPDDLSLNESVKEKCRNEYKCACKIKNYMESKCEYQVSEEELTYLTVHINRVVKTSK